MFLNARLSHWRENHTELPGHEHSYKSNGIAITLGELSVLEDAFRRTPRASEVEDLVEGVGVAEDAQAFTIFESESHE